MLNLHKIALRIVASNGKVRTAGKITFEKDRGPVRRDIRVESFSWSPESLRNLAKILWAAQRSQSYAMAAFRLFSKMPSSEYSPDGLLGGRGYISSIKDMRTGMSSAVESLSSFADTIHDEINAPHWNLGEDPPADKLVESAEEVKANPEGFVQQEFSEENEDDKFTNPAPVNPEVDSGGDEYEQEEAEEEYSDGQSQLASNFKKSNLQKEKPAKVSETKIPKVSESQLPDDDDNPQKEGKSLAEEWVHTTTPERGNYAAAIKRLVRGQFLRQASQRFADSSLPVDTLPGPRINHIGPGAADSESGVFNYDEPWPSDDPCGDGLSSGTNESKYLYEGPDANGDGVTGYDDPTDGDSSTLKTSAIKLANYSWLPGSKNEKNLNYYELGLSADDIDWMRAHNDPDPPKDLMPKREKSKMDSLWDVDF